MAHVIVIGAGLGGIPCAFALRKHLAKSHRVTLIGARPHFEFTPSNPSFNRRNRDADADRIYVCVFGTALMLVDQHEPTVPTGAPKTGYMIESMVSATAANIAAEMKEQPADNQATWNAICLADFGDTGAAFVALPQIPPRNVTWSKKGKWVHLAKIAFEKYFMRKVRTGSLTPVYETYVLKAIGIVALKQRAQ